MKEIVIKTDGSCINNGIKDKTVTGGCAFVVYENGNELYHKAFKPSFETITENRCEAAAMLAAVEWLEENTHFKARFESDSKLIIDGITGEARRKANRDIWEKLEDAIPRVAKRIAGFYHVNREENSAVDRYAKVAAKAIYCNQQ